MLTDDHDMRRGPLFGTGVAEPTRPSLPVRLAQRDTTDPAAGMQGGDDQVSAVGGEEQQWDASGEPEPDAIASGWVIPPGGSRVDAIFVLAGSSLGIGRTERATPPVWLNLDELVNLDAIGDPVDGLTEVEITMEDHRAIGAGWPDDFCVAVVTALQVAEHRPDVTPGSPADLAARQPADAVAHIDDHIDPASAGGDPAVFGGESEPSDLGPTATDPIPATDASHPVDPVPATDPTQDADADPVHEPSSIVAPDQADSSPSGPGTASLELEDVVYLGGYPGQSKRRKRCVVGMGADGLELRGGGDLHFRLGWDVVRTVEVQNADEARFRMNTRIHRDASALVVECDQGVTLLFEARDCPTIALRSAIGQLLTDVAVAVV